MPTIRRHAGKLVHDNKIFLMSLGEVAPSESANGETSELRLINTLDSVCFYLACHMFTF